MAVERKELFKERVNTGSRTYFFDVNESAKGLKYVTICESRRKGESFERNRIFIFEDGFLEFCKSFKKLYEFMSPH